jgi:DNA-binding XRE family transcriptional regulator
VGEEARKKLSRPRVHTDDPVLHSAIEKRKAGLKARDLTDDEREAYRLYFRRLRAARREQHGPNDVLIKARRAAGMTQEELGRAVGVAASTVCQWERLGWLPRSKEVREAVEDLLGPVWSRDRLEE